MPMTCQPQTEPDTIADRIVQRWDSDPLARWASTDDRIRMALDVLCAPGPITEEFSEDIYNAECDGGHPFDIAATIVAEFS